MSNSEQFSFFNEENEGSANKKVYCLGIEFENDETRREYFREELRKKLPELKQIEGFPIGESEDIIALSDPPYYTACPNPWINDFIEEWEKEKVTKYGRDVNEEYHREPFAADVNEGKNDPIYNAHSYHTKTPHKAIMRYILNYTKPGDIIFDGFCGTGMTGVAAQFCNSVKEIEELGYKIENNKILEKIEGDGNEVWSQFSELGERHAILNDLSPAAAFIAFNYNSKSQTDIFEKRGLNILNDFINKSEWAFSTLNEQGNKVIDKLLAEYKNIKNINELIMKYSNYFGVINYIVWSEVYACSNCSSEVIFYEVGLDDKKKAKDSFLCPTCSAALKKNDLDRIEEYKYDHFLNESVKMVKRVPVLINYSVGNKRFQKEPDRFDLEIINKINEEFSGNWYPTDLMMKKGEKWGDTYRAGYHTGVRRVDDFFSNRILSILSGFYKEINNLENYTLKQNLNFVFGSVLPKLTILNRYMPQHGSRALVGPMANTLYVPPLSVENNALNQFTFQFKKILKALNSLDGNILSNQSSTALNVLDNSIDYIFLDPPFGANIMYSELNFIRESWLKIFTNNKEEAIENKSQFKNILEYQQLITNCFKEAYRILKPGRWITIEFSNTQAKVWNVIQHALHEVGFIIASVDALNKSRGGLHSMIGSIAVKQDLVISAYKPNKELESELINDSSALEEAMWDFVKTHLEFIPVYKEFQGTLNYITERDPRILYDRVIAYFVRSGLQLHVSAQEFQNKIIQNLPVRDGMIFLENQVVEYDKKRAKVINLAQMELFISDENSAIEWIRQQLMKKPQTRQDLHPQFMKEIQHIAKHEQLPELDSLLLQNFLRYEGDEVVPDQIASYLRRNYHDLRGLENEEAKLQDKALNRWYVPDPNKQSDLEKLREKSLLREFESYIDELSTHKKKLKQFRTEAIRAGFKKAWSDKDYAKIVTVGDRLPESVIQEDDKLLMYYDNAQIRLDM